MGPPASRSRLQPAGSAAARAIAVATANGAAEKPIIDRNPTDKMHRDAGKKRHARDSEAGSLGANAVRRRSTGQSYRSRMAFKRSLILTPAFLLALCAFGPGPARAAYVGNHY